MSAAVYYSFKTRISAELWLLKISWKTVRPGTGVRPSGRKEKVQILQISERLQQKTFRYVVECEVGNLLWRDADSSFLLYPVIGLGVINFRYSALPGNEIWEQKNWIANQAHHAALFSSAASRAAKLSWNDEVQREKPQNTLKKSTEFGKPRKVFKVVLQRPGMPMQVTRLSKSLCFG